MEEITIFYEDAKKYKGITLIVYSRLKLGKASMAELMRWTQSTRQGVYKAMRALNTECVVEIVPYTNMKVHYYQLKEV